MLGPLLEVEISKKCTPLWREAHFQVKMYKTPHARATSGSCDVEKVYALVGENVEENVENTWGTDRFWTFRCRLAVQKVHAVVARSTFPSQTCSKMQVYSKFSGVG